VEEITVCFSGKLASPSFCTVMNERDCVTRVAFSKNIRKIKSRTAIRIRYLAAGRVANRSASSQRT
jgi:hypothetical protein